MAKQGIYVGCSPKRLEVFHSATQPTDKSHGDKYTYSVGPFKTLRGAKAMIHYGPGNPATADVNKAERIGEKNANDLRALPLFRDLP